MKKTVKGYPKNNLLILVIIALLAVIGGAIFYIRQSSLPTIHPKNLVGCTKENPIPAPEYVGMSTDRAGATAEHNKMLYKVRSIDGKPQPVTLEAGGCGNRVNVTIVHGKVTKAEYY
jgi:hypothetical protein